MTDAKHEAPAEGVGEIEGLKRRIKCLEKLAGEQSLRVMQQATRAKDAENELAALRARSSAPEAREEAQPFAWAYRLNFPDENTAWDWQAEKEKMTEAKFGQHGGILETMPLYTHPAAPSADKLRIAVEALDTITDLSVNLRQGGPDSSDLNDLSDALNTAVDVAHEALAALQAEGA